MFLLILIWKFVPHLSAPTEEAEDEALGGGAKTGAQKFLQRYLFVVNKLPHWLLYLGCGEHVGTFTGLTELNWPCAQITLPNPVTAPQSGLIKWINQGSWVWMHS